MLPLKPLTLNWKRCRLVVKIRFSFFPLPRWRLKLKEYEYEVKYKKGSSNTNADALRRIYMKGLYGLDAKRELTKEEKLALFREMHDTLLGDISG
jgi:hypothetical protein